MGKTFNNRALCCFTNKYELFFIVNQHEEESAVARVAFRVFSERLGVLPIWTLTLIKAKHISFHWKCHRFNNFTLKSMREMNLTKIMSAVVSGTFF